MIKITFRKYNFKVSIENEIHYIFDEVRKKKIKLTPEEWVRQNFIHFLMYDLQYPKAKIAVEKEIIINDLKKRFDILVYDTAMQPFLLIECKSQNENINENVLEQSLRYNMQLKVPYICISNGTYTYAWDVKTTDIKPLETLPQYV
ncbi:MAG: type I restriction enzyme HsdR N-terminal domain-containing protein [Chitinophagales bacterium]|nr:type I restriction enzyme HsdR N-terminal domain-containing protein [Bacteroidota bacterium]MCB9226755.1 type I restriction enzyme HsdR N-terminal domain-containing protein [Chitinophagales bacterium]